RSEESHWVQCELSMAVELKKPIFPLLLEGRRWLSVAAISEVNVVGGKLPPARFFDTLRPYFLPATPTAVSLPLQSVAADSIFADPLGWAPPTTPTTPNKPPTAEDDLSSEKGVDYRKLRNLLKAGKWKEADQETGRCMLEALGRKENDYIHSEELQNFPCADLRTIDALWVKYSKGKWGFSVQKRIYVECGAKLNGKYPGDEIWYEFCRRVGWRKGDSYVSYSNLTFDLQKSSVGEFPVGWGFAGLFSRIETCKL
ncbi:MAG: GUN4 domain-containing protein, partial [Cyanobacteria bacterium J06638_6]